MKITRFILFIVILFLLFATMLPSTYSLRPRSHNKPSNNPNNVRGVDNKPHVTPPPNPNDDPSTRHDLPPVGDKPSNNPMNSPSTQPTTSPPPPNIDENRHRANTMMYSYNPYYVISDEITTGRFGDIVEGHDPDGVYERHIPGLTNRATNYDLVRLSQGRDPRGIQRNSLVDSTGINFATRL